MWLVQIRAGSKITSRGDKGARRRAPDRLRDSARTWWQASRLSSCFQLKSVIFAAPGCSCDSGIRGNRWAASGSRTMGSLPP